MSCARIVLLFLGFFSVGFAASDESPFYATFGSGIGDTSWSMLKSKSRYNGDINRTTDMTNPIGAKDTGEEFEIGAGWNISDQFAIEADVQHYARSHLSFSEVEAVDFYRRQILKIYGKLPANGKFSSTTDSARVVGKFELPVPHTKGEAYLDAGPSYTYRSDILAKIGGIGASFGGGVKYPVGHGWDMDTGFSYSTGYGKSVVDPGDKYIPFVYAFNVNMVHAM